jgi:hypothetical protein
MAEGTSNKDVIYVDVDDEITSIIDKVRSSKHQIIALVLPKRSAVLQSIVNMKLLKRTADRAKKNVVLITADEGLLPLAGSVGMHVARNLQSRPEIPEAPEHGHSPAEDEAQEIDMNGAADEDAPVDRSKSVGELAGGEAAEEGAIEMGDEGAEEASSQDDAKPNKKDKKKNKDHNKSLHVPNFNKFRTWVVIAACAVIVLIILAVIAMSTLPKAVITINTNSQTVGSNLQITLSSNATDTNANADVVPAQVAQAQKTYTGTATATGKQNNGQKASGSITMTVQECSFPIHQPSAINSGTGVSSNGLTFITQESTTFPKSGTADNSGCIDFTANDSTSIEAQSGGANYNLSSANFTVNSSTSATGSTDGGTDSIVQIVQQADIDSAKGKISPNTAALKSQLKGDLQSQGLFPIPATFSASTPDATTNANVGDQANSVTATESITYTMYGAKQSDLQKLIASSVDGQISTTSQKILDYGLSSASFTVQDQSSNSEAVTMQDNALVGFAINQAAIKKTVAGQKPGTAEGTIRGYSGVTSANVHLSPFWVTSIPKKTSKITVNIVNPKS